MAFIKDGHVAEESTAPFLSLDELLASNDGERVRLPNDVDLERLEPRLSGLAAIEIEFPGYADGRGFSIARQLRRQYGYTGQIIAAGPLIPDQYSYALQCGFDAVKVDEDVFARHGASDWRSALDAFNLTYQRGYALPNGPAMSVFTARKAKRAADAKGQYEGLSAEAALERAIYHDYKGEIVLASSMGIDSAVLLHMISEIDNRTPVLFLETGKHFKETLAYRDHLIARFGLSNFKNIYPDAKTLKRKDAKGDLHETDRDSCCEIRKVAPLDAEIKQYKARITGRKRYQTKQRAHMPILELGGQQAKINPLAYWTAKDITAYMRKHDLPVHPLLSLGYLSVGCEPCTTRVAEGEDPRAGRWRDSNKTECGIHYIKGRYVRSEDNPRTYAQF